MITLVSNCTIYVVTPQDQANQETLEVLKVSKFYEFVHDKPIVGMTVQSPVDMQLQGQETRIVESWPLIQAYGLDSK